jgi:hypothetical protein
VKVVPEAPEEDWEEACRREEALSTRPSLRLAAATFDLVAGVDSGSTSVPLADGF